MKYEKPPLPFEAQADLLINRGMKGDRSIMVERLRAVGYYRLSAYTFPFRRDDPSQPGARLSEFREGTTFDAVWERYVFDRRLRLTVMDAVERIEVAVRSLIATGHALRHNAFAYASDSASLPGLRRDEWQRFKDGVAVEQERSREAFAQHFREKYGRQHSYLPIWMAAEVLSFGSLLTMLRGCASDLKREIAAPFGVHEVVHWSWMLALNTVRNTCAHHGRLWNRELGVKPKIPARLREWQTPVTVGNDRVFGTLTICKWCLDRIAPQSSWAERLVSLLRENPGVPLGSMGFPSNWTESPIWNSTTASPGQ